MKNRKHPYHVGQLYVNSNMKGFKSLSNDKQIERLININVQNVDLNSRTNRNSIYRKILNAQVLVEFRKAEFKALPNTGKLKAWEVQAACRDLNEDELKEVERIKTLIAAEEIINVKPSPE